MFPEMIKTLLGGDLERLEGKVTRVASPSCPCCPLTLPLLAQQMEFALSLLFPVAISPLMVIWCLLPLCCCLLTSSPFPNLD